MSRWRMLRSLGRCSLEKVDLLMAGGAVEVLLVSLSCPLPFLRNHHCESVAFLFSRRWEQPVQHLDGWRWTYFVWEAGWKEPLWYNPGFSCIGILKICIASRSLLPISMQTKQGPREPVLLMALKIMLHAKLCLSVMKLLICVYWHPERTCRALSSWGQRGQVRLNECFNHTAWLYRVPVLYFIMMHLV